MSELLTLVKKCSHFEKNGSNSGQKSTCHHLDTAALLQLAKPWTACLAIYAILAGTRRDTYQNIYCDRLPIAHGRLEMPEPEGNSCRLV
jgi:hypothetical protein